MSPESRHRLFSATAAIACVAAMPLAAMAQSTAAPPQQDRGNWLKNLTRLMTPHSEDEQYKREHSSVMSAFRDVVGMPSKSTVRVYCNGRPVALGTIVASEGMVLTKDSELRDKSGKLEDEIFCELAEGSRYPAQLVSRHQHTDLALLKLPTRGLPAIQWSSTTSPSTGSWVVTPGLGDQPEAIGVVSVTPHTVRGGVLGVFLDDVENGARVWRVVPGGGADSAGIQSDDVISHINGEAIGGRDELVAILNTVPPGEKVELSLHRSGQQIRKVAELGSMTDTFGSRRALFQNSLGSKLSSRKEAFPSVFEHDSVLHPHECGGPVVDLEGKALGINIARASRVSSYALPADVVRQTLNAMLSNAGDLATVSHQAQSALAESTGR